MKRGYTSLTMHSLRYKVTFLEYRLITLKMNKKNVPLFHHPEYETKRTSPFYPRLAAILRCGVCGYVKCDR